VNGGQTFSHTFITPAPTNTSAFRTSRLACWRPLPSRKKAQS
jgi:hypothetical protein